VSVLIFGFGVVGAPLFWGTKLQTGWGLLGAWRALLLTVWGLLGAWRCCALGLSVVVRRQSVRSIE